MPVHYARNEYIMEYIMPVLNYSSSFHCYLELMYEYNILYLFASETL